MREPQETTADCGVQQRCGSGPLKLQTLPVSHTFAASSQGTQPPDATLQTRFCAPQLCTWNPQPLELGLDSLHFGVA